MKETVFCKRDLRGSLLTGGGEIRIKLLVGLFQFLNFCRHFRLAEVPKKNVILYV